MARSEAAHLKGSESLSEQRDFDDFYRACREEIARALVLAAGHRDLGLEATGSVAGDLDATFDFVEIELG